jgi:hypothetical protein
MALWGVCTKCNRFHDLALNCETAILPAKKTKKYSPSNINHFFKCPYRWYLHQIEKKQGIITEAPEALFSKSVHLLIQDYYSQVKNPSPKQIETTATAIFQSSDLWKPNETKIKTILKNFITFEQSKQPYLKPILVEQWLEDDNFGGYIDYFDGKMLIDWKLGNFQMDDDARRQGKIYELLVKHNGYTQPFKVYFITLLNGRKLEMPLTTEPWLMQQVQRMYNMVEAKRFPKCLTGLCNFCEVQLECELEGLNLWDGILA